MTAVGEVGVVGEVGGPGDYLSIDENGFGQDDVGEVGAAAFIGVVADEDVAGQHVGDGVALQHGFDDADETAEVHRDVFGLAEGAAFGVEQSGGAVAALLDVGRIAGADQGLAHLLDDGGEGAADDLDGDGVDRDASRHVIRHQAISRIRLA